MTCIFASAPVVEKKPDPNTSKTITAPKLGQWTLRSCTIGALIIRIGFWGIFYYIYNKEPPPHHSIGNYAGPYIRGLWFRVEEPNV